MDIEKIQRKYLTNNYTEEDNYYIEEYLYNFIREDNLKNIVIKLLTKMIIENKFKANELQNLIEDYDSNCYELKFMRKK